MRPGAVAFLCPPSAKWTGEQIKRASTEIVRAMSEGCGAKRGRGATQGEGNSPRAVAEAERPRGLADIASGDAPIAWSLGGGEWLDGRRSQQCGDGAVVGPKAPSPSGQRSHSCRRALVGERSPAKVRRWRRAHEADRVGSTCGETSMPRKRRTLGRILLCACNHLRSACDVSIGCGGAGASQPSSGRHRRFGRPFGRVGGDGSASRQPGGVPAARWGRRWSPVCHRRNWPIVSYRMRAKRWRDSRARLLGVSAHRVRRLLRPDDCGVSRRTTHNALQSIS